MTIPTKKPVRPAKNQISLHGHPPNMIRVFAVRVKKPRVLSYPLKEGTAKTLWSDWADAQADLSLLGVCHFAGFVMLILITYHHDNMMIAKFYKLILID